MNGISQKSILVAIVLIAVVGLIVAGFSQNANIVIGFATLICVSFLGPYLQVRAAAAQQQKLEVVAAKTELAVVKAEEVKRTVVATEAKRAEKLEEIVAKVEEIHAATNSLTDRLVETTKAEAHAAGVKEEKERNQ